MVLVGTAGALLVSRGLALSRRARNALNGVNRVDGKALSGMQFRLVCVLEASAKGLFHNPLPRREGAGRHGDSPVER
jgi:hypothetical protein